MMFALDPSELGTTNVTNHTINTHPIQQPPRHMPFTHREQVVKVVKMLESVTVPSASPWASSVVVVCKKDWGVHFHIDYSQLKGVTKTLSHR